MEYFIQGKGKVKLTKKDFIAKGGEGSIYGKNNIIYKIYEDRSKVILPSKIKELSVFNHNTYIINPQSMLLDKRNRPVGFTMDWIKNTIALCKLFTTSYWDEHHIKVSTILAIIDGIKKIITEAHKNKCLIVDGNELNYIIKSQKTPYCIDVDSWETPSFSATAIMPSIRDYHAKKFDTNTDWFSFAIIACQLFVGIHPFKGKHPDFSRKDGLETRMIANKSIFNKHTTIPKSTRNFTIIPKHYYEWFVELFENGKRIPPPAMPGELAYMPVTITHIKGSNLFHIELIEEYNKYETVLHIQTCNNKKAVRTTNCVFLDKNKIAVNKGVDILYTPRELRPILVNIVNGTLEMFDVTNSRPIKGIEVTSKEFMICDNILFSRYGDKLTEIRFHQIGNTILSSVKTSWNIMPNSSQMLDGLIYMDAADTPFIIVPSSNQIIYEEIPELKGYKIITGKHDNKVVILIGYNRSTKVYDRIVLRFNMPLGIPRYRYDCRITENVDDRGVNFVTRDNGICTAICDGVLEVFSNNPKNSDIRTFEDPIISSSIKLHKDGLDLLLSKRNKLYSITMK